MEERAKKMLLIVDPQIDFINGTLPVPGAGQAMDALAVYVKNHGTEYNSIVVTCDRHPMRHSSFEEFGGKWPPHCIEGSVGAAIWPPLMKALLPLSANVVILYKGEDIAYDEYSIFGSENGADEMFTLITKKEISEIDICGLAGDVCVATTLKDAMSLYPELRFRILEPYIASLDNGKCISEKIRDFKSTHTD